MGLVKVLLWKIAGATGCQSPRAPAAPWMARVERPSRRAFTRRRARSRRPPWAAPSAARPAPGGAPRRPRPRRSRPASRRRAGSRPEAVALEHRLDGFAVAVGQAHEEEEAHPVPEQFGDDLVGAGVVEAPHAGEIHSRD